MLQAAHNLAAVLLIIYGLLNVLLFGSPFMKKFSILASSEHQKLFFEVRAMNTIIGIIMLVCGFYIAHW